MSWVQACILDQNWVHPTGKTISSNSSYLNPALNKQVGPLMSTSKMMVEASQAHQADQLLLSGHWVELQGKRRRFGWDPQGPSLWSGWGDTPSISAEPRAIAHIGKTDAGMWVCQDMLGYSIPQATNSVKPVCNGLIKAIALHFYMFGSVISPSYKGKETWMEIASSRLQDDAQWGRGWLQPQSSPKRCEIPLLLTTSTAPKTPTPSSYSASTKFPIKYIPSPSTYLFI